MINFYHCVLHFGQELEKFEFPDQFKILKWQMSMLLFWCTCHKVRNALAWKFMWQITLAKVECESTQRANLLALNTLYIKVCELLLKSLFCNFNVNKMNNALTLRTHNIICLFTLESL